MRDVPADLKAAAGPAPLPAVEVLIERVALAMALGFVVAVVYRLTVGRRTGAGGLPTTLVLLSVMLALVTVVIRDSLALAFGLVGALSIVRFRTVVEDTRDTAFVIFAVVVGMAAGAGDTTAALVGIPAVGLAAWAMHWFDRPAAPATQQLTLTVRIGLGHDPEAALGPVFARHGLSPRLTGVATARQGAAVEFTYALPPVAPAAMAKLVADANRAEGVQGVELRG